MTENETLEAHRGGRALDAACVLMAGVNASALIFWITSVMAPPFVFGVVIAILLVNVLWLYVLNRVIHAIFIIRDRVVSGRLGGGSSENAAHG